VFGGEQDARAKGKRLGRPQKHIPQKHIDVAQIVSLRAAWVSWRAIFRKIGVSVGTVFAVAQEDHEPETVSTSVAGTDVRVACLPEVISGCQLA
jgi:DNA invertase Pin-like site-specific DNA recombinase